MYLLYPKGFDPIMFPCHARYRLQHQLYLLHLLPWDHPSRIRFGSVDRMQQKALFVQPQASNGIVCLFLWRNQTPHIAASSKIYFDTWLVEYLLYMGIVQGSPIFLHSEGPCHSDNITDLHLNRKRFEMGFYVQGSVL